MRHIEDEKIKNIIIENNILEQSLQTVKQKHKNEEISFCGIEKSWEDCITANILGNNVLYVLFYYNINNNTYSIMNKILI